MEVDTKSTTNCHRSLNSVYSDPSFSESGKPCDAFLKTDDGSEFQVHSEVLSRKSEFFKTIFSLSEESGQSIAIHGIKPDTFETVLIYLCTGRVALNPENMMDLLVAPNFLMIESLTSQCSKFAMQNKTIDNCMILFLTANRIKGLNMEAQCRRFLEINFERAVEHSADEVSMLSFDALKYFLSSKSLNVSSERAVWSLIEVWVQTDPSNRIPLAPELLRYVDINRVDDDLASELIFSPLIRKSILSEVLGYPNVTMAHLSDKSKAFVVMSYNGAPLIDGVRQPHSVYFVTKNSKNDSGAWMLQMFLTYDDNFDVWRKLGDFSRGPVTLCRVGHLVFFLDDNDRVFKYDLLRYVTRPMTPPPSEFMLVMEAGSHLYAMGDIDGNKREDIYEYVDETDEWVRITSVPPITVRKTVSLGGLLYVIGSIKPYFSDMALQVYDPSADRWDTLTPPRVRRYSMAAVEYREMLFLIGGQTPYGLSRDVEVYDRVRDEWVFYPELIVEYDEGVKATVVKGRLFVYECDYPTTYWDESSRQWRVIEDSSPLHDLCDYHFFPIEDEELVGELVKKNKACGASDWLQTGLGNEILLKSSN